MCGITGFFGFEDDQLLDRMTNVVHHRGPNQSGYFSDYLCSLGHRRLSIIDLSEYGRQPISNEDQSIHITFNGEIYNFQEIKNKLRNHQFTSETDTEVIVYGYEEYGNQIIPRLNGCFAFAIYDSNKKEILLARDRMGIKPLYYTVVDNKLLFASEIKSILEYPIKREVNRNALNYYLSFFTNITHETMFKGIYKLPPGHYATFNENGLHIQKYWDIPTNHTSNPKQMYSLLSDSVQKRLMSDVPLGIYLSGGIDSATVTSLVSNFSDNIKTFTVGFDQYSEFKPAKITSDYFNTDHKEILVNHKSIKELPNIVWHQDEPMGDPTSIPTFLLSKEAKKSVTVVLTGEGADEQFAGYEQEKFMMLHQKYVQKFPLFFRKPSAKILQTIPAAQLNYFFKYMGQLGDEGKKRVSQFLSTNNTTDALMSMLAIFSEKEKNKLTSSYPINPIIEKKFFQDSQSLLSQLLRFENKVLLTENLLMKVDKNTMAHGIEARVPFLDHRVVEFAAGLPNNQKIRGFKDKYILRNVMKPYLPQQQKKQRFFVPVDAWLKHDLQPVLEQLLNKSTIQKQGFFNYYYIQKALDRYNRSPLYYGRQLWTLLNFQMWHKMFIDGEKVIIQ